MNLAFKMIETTESLGQRLKRLRKSKGLRQEDIANIVGVKPQSIGSIERTSSDSLKMDEIAQALGVSLSYLKSGKEATPLTVVSNYLTESDSYTLSNVSEALPQALNKTVNTVRNILMQQGLLEQGDFSLLKNRDLVLRVMTKAILMEISGDIQISGFNPEKESSAKSNSD
jgi:transcriptional regulator with XRE-family HTH domain